LTLEGSYATAGLIYLSDSKGTLYTPNDPSTQSITAIISESRAQLPYIYEGREYRE